MYGPGKEGSEWRSRRAEHSVPAGDKREACQRPNNSGLTHTTIYFTHIHLHMLTQSFTLYSILGGGGAFFFHTVILPASIVFLMNPICHILYFSFCTLIFSCMHHTCLLTHFLAVSHYVHGSTATMGRKWLISKQIAFKIPFLPFSLAAVLGNRIDSLIQLSSLCKNDAISSCRDESLIKVRML